MPGIGRRNMDGYILSDVGFPEDDSDATTREYVDVLVASNIAPQGPAGPAGPQGPSLGPQGVQGVQGVRGLDGLSGNPGTVGPQGDQGAAVAGPQGVQGPQGNQGDRGVRGYQGNDGSPGGPQGAVGSQGGTGPQGLAGYPALSGVDYAVIMEHPIGVVAWVKMTSAMLGAVFSGSMALSVTVYECGATLTNPSFTCAYSDTPDSASIADAEANSVVLTAPFTSGTLTQTYTKTGVNDSELFTLTSAKGAVISSPTATAYWQPKVGFGSLADSGVYDSAFVTSIIALGSALAGARQRTISYNSTTGQYMWYVIPTSYGGTADNFIDASTGWPSGFSKVATGVSRTNTYGVAITYDVWRSDQSGLGAVNITVQ